MITEIELNPERTYKDRATAIHYFEKTCAKLGIEDMCFVAVGEESGRFFCVAIPSETQVQHAVALAYQGISSVRR